MRVPVVEVRWLVRMVKEEEEGGLTFGDGG